MIQLPSSLIRTQLLAIPRELESSKVPCNETRYTVESDLPSSNSNSWSSSKLLRFSGSYLDDLFLRRASQSGSGLAVDGPATVYLRPRVSDTFISHYETKSRSRSHLMLTQELSQDLSTSWWMMVLPGQEISSGKLQKLWMFKAENQKVSTALSKRKAGRDQVK